MAATYEEIHTNTYLSANFKIDFIFKFVGSKLPDIQVLFDMYISTLFISH